MILKKNTTNTFILINLILITLVLMSLAKIQLFCSIKENEDCEELFEFSQFYSIFL